jgi:zinc protease
LDNGVRVVVKENHGAGLVSIQVWIRAGSRYETRANNGISHVLEHLVFRGSASLGAEELKREIEGVGGYVNAETSRDSTHFEALVTTRFYARALSALADCLLHPRLDAKDFSDEREVIEAELSARLADPTFECGEMMMAARFKAHPYGLPQGGTPGSLRRLDASLLREFHSQYYVGPNMSVVVIGDVPAAEAVAKVREAFSTAPNRKPPPATPPSESPIESPRRVSKIAPIQQVVMSLAFPGPGIGTPKDVLAMDVLLTALGEGATSILQSRLRGTPPLVTGFEVDYLTQKDPGAFSVTCILPRATMNAAQAAVLGAIRELREQPLPDKQLEQARNVLEGLYTYQNETAAGQGSSMGFYEAIDSYEFALTYIDEFRRVTADQIQAVAGRYFDPDAYVLAVVEPPARGGGLEARTWFAPLPAASEPCREVAGRVSGRFPAFAPQELH